MRSKLFRQKLFCCDNISDAKAEILSEKNLKEKFDTSCSRTLQDEKMAATSLSVTRNWFRAKRWVGARSLVRARSFLCLLLALLLSFSLCSCGRSEANKTFKPLTAANASNSPKLQKYTVKNGRTTDGKKQSRNTKRVSSSSKTSKKPGGIYKKTTKPGNSVKAAGKNPKSPDLTRDFAPIYEPPVQESENGYSPAGETGDKETPQPAADPGKKPNKSKKPDKKAENPKKPALDPKPNPKPKPEPKPRVTAKPKPKPKPTTKPKPREFTVTLTVTCHRALMAGGSEAYRFVYKNYSDGVMLAPQSMKAREGEYVFDVMMRSGLDIDHEDSMYGEYISCINGLRQKMGGNWSGWKYKVNGEIAPCGISFYKLSAGDVIEFYYCINVDD